MNRAALALAVAAGACPAQSPSVWQWHEVPAAATTVFAVLWQHGFDHDAASECGAALALAECRLARAREAVPAAVASGVRVLDDATVAFVLVPAGATRHAVAFCRALLDDTVVVGDDLVARAIARAALAADDAEWLYPGTALAGRARRALLAGPASRGVAGSAAAVQDLTPARLRELLRQPVAVLAVGVGAVPAAVQQAASGLPLPPAPPAVRPVAAPGPVAAARSGPESWPHARVDGPFASIAFVVPHGVDRAALAVAIEVARSRAARSLPLRGGEAQGRAPVVSWSWLQAEPLVVFCRRGRNGDEPTRPWAELEGLLADLAARAPTAAECDSAVRALCAELGFCLPVAAAGGAALPGWAMSSLLARHRSIVGTDVEAVTAGSAHAALQATCDPARAWRGALVPTAATASR